MCYSFYLSLLTELIDACFVIACMGVCASTQQDYSQPTPPVIKLPQSLATQNYDMRPRTHNRQLPDRSGHLTDCNFLTRLLYNDIY